LKEGIEPLKGALDVVRAMRPRFFSWKKDEKRTRVPGFIAQEHIKANPHAVLVGGEDPEKAPWQIHDDANSPYYAAAIQELEALVLELRGRIVTLEKGSR
jgi:hypothetical protein